MTDDAGAPQSGPPSGHDDVGIPSRAAADEPFVVDFDDGGGRRRAAARRRRARRRAVAIAGTVVLVGALAVLGAFAWYRTQLSAAGGPHTPVEVVVPRGSSNADIGTLLARREVIRNARVFAWHVRFSGDGPFEAGRYRFARHSSVDAALGVLGKGPLPPLTVKVTIPEGFRTTQILDRIHAKVPRFSVASLQAALAAGEVTSPFLPAGSTNYEGLLFPATYLVTEKTTGVELLQQMADALADRAVSMDLVEGAKALGLSPYEVIIVASLVQAEAGNPDEAPKIARVIYNRLAQGQPLGIDATSRYLSIISGEPVDFESASPYNTRRNPGLPPTPIGAPGDVALLAALHPAPGDWLYYVRDVNNDAQGRPQHLFTASPEEFARAKQACHDAGLGCGAS